MKAIKILVTTVMTALLLLYTGCSTAKRSSHANRVDSQTSSSQTHFQHHKPSHRQKLLVKEANTWLGTPYKYGAQEKGIATDCSGFVMMVYQTALGVKIPRNSAKQAEFCKKLKEEDVRTGDLVFFATGNDPERVTHVGMMIDDEGTFIHASSSKGVVHSKMSNQWYRKRLLMYGRVDF